MSCGAPLSTWSKSALRAALRAAGRCARGAALHPTRAAAADDSAARRRAATARPSCRALSETAGTVTPGQS
eukprot:7380738-Prymnesium_polylepis.1